MKLLALVTLYHPSPGVEQRMATYAPHADALLLWDNTPGGSPLMQPEAVHRKVLSWRKGPNMGIGQALNEALRLAVTGGGHLNGALLAAGLLDEVSVMIGPGIDGRRGMTAVFDGIDDPSRPATLLSLRSVERVNEGTVWLRYAIAPTED